MRTLAGPFPGWGITAVRVMMAVILLVSAYLKITNLAGAISFFGRLGIPLPEVLAPLDTTMELVGGLLILVGFASRWIGLWFIGEFLVTAFYVKLPRVGWDDARIDLMMLAAAVMLVLAGSGKASVDELLMKRRAATVDR